MKILLLSYTLPDTSAPVQHTNPPGKLTLTSLISAGCRRLFPPLTKGFLSSPAAVASAFLPSVESPPTGPKSHCTRSPFWDLTCPGGVLRFSSPCLLICS